MSLVPALSSDFGIGLCIFFCLTLVSALCKNIGIGPSVNFLLKKHETNGVPCGPIISHHVARKKRIKQKKVQRPMPRSTNTNIFIKCRDQYQYFYKVQGPIPIVLCFF